MRVGLISMNSPKSQPTTWVCSLGGGRLQWHVGCFGSSHTTGNSEECKNCDYIVIALILFMFRKGKGGFRECVFMILNFIFSVGFAAIQISWRGLEIPCFHFSVTWLLQFMAFFYLTRSNTCMERVLPGNYSCTSKFEAFSISNPVHGTSVCH